MILKAAQAMLRKLADDNPWAAMGDVSYNDDGSITLADDYEQRLLTTPAYRQAYDAAFNKYKMFGIAPAKSKANTIARQKAQTEYFNSLVPQDIRDANPNAKYTYHVTRGTLDNLQAPRMVWSAPGVSRQGTAGSKQATPQPSPQTQPRPQSRPVYQKPSKVIIPPQAVTSPDAAEF